MFLTLLFSVVLTFHALVLSDSGRRSRQWFRYFVISLMALLLSLPIDFATLSDRRIDGLAFGGLCG